MDKLIGHDFQLNDGTYVSIDDILKAKVILLHFSAIWCPPCILL